MELPTLEISKIKKNQFIRKLRGLNRKKNKVKIKEIIYLPEMLKIC